MKTNDKKSLIIKNKPIKRDNLDNKYKVIKLSDIATLKNGYAFKESDYISDGEYNVITISNVKGNRYIENINCASKTKLPPNIMNHQILKENDILISMTGNVGRVSLNSGKNNLLNQRVGVLYVDSQIYVEWLFQYLSSKKFKEEMIIKSTGAAQKNISKEDIESFRLFIPSFKEQKKIGKMLKTLDELILLYEKKLTALETYNKGLRQKLFNQSIRFKSFDGTSYPDWEKKRLEDVCELITKGTTPKNYSDNLNDVNYIKIESIVSNKICLDKCVKIDESIHQGILKRSILKEGDILFAIAGSLGTMAIVENKILPANTNQALAIIRLNKNCCAEYIYAVLHSIIMSQYINQCCTIGAQPNLSLKQMNDFVFPYPCLKEQQKIAEVLSCADELTEQIKNKILLLKITKTSLLNDIFD